MFKKLLNFKYFNIAFISLMAMFFIGDRVLKNIALNRANEENVTLIKNLLYFKFQANENISFSLPIPNNIATIIVVIMIFALLYFLYYFKIKNKKNNTIFLSLLTIILGAISNLIDRLNYSFVIDYFYIPWFTVLNIADLMISFAGIYLMIILLFYSKKYNI